MHKLSSLVDSITCDGFCCRILPRGPTVWAALARKMGPQALRMNWNTLLRHDVFKSGLGILPVGKKLIERNTGWKLVPHDGRLRR